MDIKEKIEELIEKIKNDDDLMESFKKNPVKAVESLIGVDLPDDQLEKVVEGIKSKISLDNLGGMLGGLFGRK